MKKSFGVVSLLLLLAFLLMMLSGCALDGVINKLKRISFRTVSAEDERLIWDFLYEKIENPYGAAALMGNLYAESKLLSDNLQDTYQSALGYTDSEYTKAVDSGEYLNFVKDGAGYGIAQWTFYTRKQALLDYAAEKDTSIGDLEMQLEFLWNELQGYPNVIKALREAKDVKTASFAVLTGFERPTDQGEGVQNARTAFGEKYYDKYEAVFVSE